MIPSEVVPPSERQREDIMRVFRDVFMERRASDPTWDACRHRWMRHYPDLVLKLESIGITFCAVDKP